jgi:chemotaxis protein methyltransferase CheR
MTFSINDHIKSIVKFQQFNLQSSFLLLGRFDVVFLKYVLIYFSEKLKEEIAAKIFRVMDDQSILFIGASELYEQIKKNFEMNMYENGVYYTRRRAF